MAQRIAAEPTGDYFIGRRYYKPDYKFWGYVRKPGQPWSTAELVMLNEKQKLAPDRERLEFGSDNNYEYKLYGYFSGDKVYEPASNGIYPEFVLKGYELISTNPPPIFRSQMSGRSIQPTCGTSWRNRNDINDDETPKSEDRMRRRTHVSSDFDFVIVRDSSRAR